LDAVEIFADDPTATFFRFGKAARVQKHIFETGSQIQLALIKHGQNTDEQKRFPSPVAARHPLPAWAGRGKTFARPPVISLSPPNGERAGARGTIFIFVFNPIFIRI
jgi:hypothetical protein